MVSLFNLICELTFFLNLQDKHTENELQRGLIKQMKSFILELGKDFLFIGEEYKLQVVK